MPDSLAAGTPEPLRSDLVALLGADRVLARVSDLVRYASDASPYRLIPKAVVMAHDAGDVAEVMAYGRRTGVPVTFRAAGTSLNGQAQGDGDHGRRAPPLARREGRGRRARARGCCRARCSAHVNAVLAPHGRRLGPDPASTDIATVGGVIANNSGGMRCGVVHDSYQTVRSLTFALPSGTAIDTAAPGAEAQFAAREPELARGLIEIRDEIRADTELAERIRRKFEIKNTMGYRLVAFLDADTPLEIFRRLIVGSEGTLAFVSEAVFDTVPFGRHRATAFVLFPAIDEAVACVQPLVEAGASATELMMVLAMKAAQAFAPIPPEWNDAPERRGRDPGRVPLRRRGRAGARARREAMGVFAGRPRRRSRREFTRDPELTEVYWRVREGLHGLLGKLRPRGTSLIIEDVCVPPERDRGGGRGDPRAARRSTASCPGVAGHASAGNLHFMLTPAFGEPADRDRYEAFMGDLVDADRGQVRRLAEGGARHRAQHGAVGRARVGREGDRDDVADQGARRPGTACLRPACC